MKKYLYYTFIIVFVIIGCKNESHISTHDEDEDTEHGHNGELIIPPSKAAKFGIEYETIEPRPFQEVIKTSGIIEASNSDIYTITAKKSGILKLADGISEGMTVAAGQKIASLSSSGMEGGDKSRAAGANLAAAKAEYERLKPLYEDKLVTAATFREAERAYNEAQALASNRIPAISASENSPVAGTISRIFVNNGQFVEAGSPIAVVSKNSTMTLKADLPMKYVSKSGYIENANFIPDGTEKVVNIKDIGGKKVSGMPAESRPGYIPLYFSFSGDPLSYPRGYAEIYLLGPERNNVISVPRKAILEMQGNKFLYVVEDGHAYEKRLIKTGADNGIRVEVTEGVYPGDTIVANGASIVRMAEMSEVAPPSHNHNH